MRIRWRLESVKKFVETFETLDIPHEDGLKSGVDNCAGWAFTDLKHVGAVDNIARGVWIITESGRKI